MSKYLTKPKSLGANVKTELDWSNYKTKTESKNATVGDTWDFVQKDLANLKPNIDKSDIDTLKNVPTNSSNLKSKVDKLDIDKLVPVPVDLSKPSDVVKNDVAKEDVHHPKIKEYWK